MSEPANDSDRSFSRFRRPMLFTEFNLINGRGPRQDRVGLEGGLVREICYNAIWRKPMSEIVLTLPDDIATEANELGLFKPLLVTSMFKDEIRRRKANRLFETAERLAVAGAPMTDEEIIAEVRESRAERRSRS